jgi:exonuclease VII small subunit
MRRIIRVVLAFLFMTMAGGPILAQNADKCAAEKNAVESAMANYKTTEKALMTAIDAMADAYGEVSTATNDAKTKNDEYVAAYKRSVAAWDAYYGCHESAANHDCKAERDAVWKAQKEFEAAEKASSDAEMALGAAKMVLEDAKAKYRAAAAAEKAAQEDLDEARAALAKCLSRRLAA